MKKIKGYVIGRGIKVSYSPEIYASFDKKIEYKIKNLASYESLGSFLDKKAFDFINITMPYKQDVIDFCDSVSDIVKETNACNLIVNRFGKLKGYNTDVYGFKMLLLMHNIDVENKNVLVLGNGSTSRSVQYALKEFGPKTIDVACREKRSEKEIFYNEIIEEKYNFIINTTPVGKNQEKQKLIKVEKFKNLETLIDVNYTSYKTTLMLEAKECGKGVLNGLEMLFYQAKLAYILATKKMIPSFIYEKSRIDLHCLHTNIVLTGLPTSGKSKIGKKLHKLLNVKDNISYIDTDKIVEKTFNKKVADIFKIYGEPTFRATESEIIDMIKDAEGVVISTGGGTIINTNNYRNLSKHGIIIYLKKTKFDDFKDDNKRPLVKSKEDLMMLYKFRNSTYEERADITVSSDIDAETLIDEVVNAIINY